MGQKLRNESIKIIKTYVIKTPKKCPKSLKKIVKKYF